MKKYFALFLSIWIVFSIGAVVYADETVIDLVAGQHEVIGNVTVEQVGNDLIVTYNVTEPGWCLTTTHLYVGNTPAQRHSPGRFPYKHENLDCVSLDTFTISNLSSDTVYIAAHADAFYSRNNNLNLNGSVQYTLDGGKLDSYFDNNVVGVIEGAFNGWCVDVDHVIFIGQKYDGTTYSTLDSFPGELVDRPENMDLVNYIINQGYLAQGMSYGDVQLAIWTLIDDHVTYPGPYTPANVEAIIADALANGEGFKPSCGDVVAIIIEPTVDAQTTIIEYPVPCLEGADRKETAWALADNGIAFRQGWGSYFQITLHSTDTTTVESAISENSLINFAGNVDIVLVETATTAITQAEAATNAADNDNNSSNHGDNDKVKVCHAAGQSGNWVQLEISRNGLNGFFNDDGSPRNGLDYIGECQS